MSLTVHLMSAPLLLVCLSSCSTVVAQGCIKSYCILILVCLCVAYPTAAGSHRLRYIPGSYKAWNPNDELEDMTPQELAAHQPAGRFALDSCRWPLSSCNLYQLVSLLPQPGAPEQLSPKIDQVRAHSNWQQVIVW